MILLVLILVAGLVAGALLLRVVPVLPNTVSHAAATEPVTVIVPARNEEANLPPLLTSLQNSSPTPTQVLVVDDGSTDSTAAIASSLGATVLSSTTLPPGWTGKNWACAQGAAVASGDILLFLDADTYFTQSGYGRLVNQFTTLPHHTALSILPFHRTRCWYEELSIFFNILVAMGAGGFGGIDAPRLFGQSLLIRHELYFAAGGHECVKNHILENLHFAAPVRAAGGVPKTLCGRGALEMRMFPEGLAQLRESWQKAFATGAATTSPRVLVLSILWLAAAMMTAIAAIATRAPVLIALYVLYAGQIFWYGRQLGTFRLLTALLYPVPLGFYFAIFTQSLWRRSRKQQVTWRGRQL